jgi:hypothetical protein
MAVNANIWLTREELELAGRYGAAVRLVNTTAAAAVSLLESVDVYSRDPIALVQAAHRLVDAARALEQARTGTAYELEELAAAVDLVAVGMYADSVTPEAVTDAL